MQVASNLNAHLFKQTNAHIIKMLLSITILITFQFTGLSQNVGIGTNLPPRKLSVRGSIMIDQGNQNQGTLDSAALVFGTTAGVGISSRKTVGPGYGSLSFWTSNQENMTLSATGNLGINGPYSASHVLYVNDGNSYFDGSVTANLSISSGGSITALGAVTGNFLEVASRAGIGGGEVGAYRLYVHNGNSYFQGNISSSGNTVINGSHTVGGNSNVMGNSFVDGTITTDNNLVIKGTGSVRSEGNSPLRIGFETLTINPYVDYSPHEYSTHLINLPEFGSESDIQVSFTNYVPADAVFLSFVNRFRFFITAVNPGTNTCTLRILNDSDSPSSLKGVISLMTVIKDN